MLLLPGTHLIPEKETLNVSNFCEVVIHPWKEELEMVIECKGYLTNIWFQNIIELKILSLRFYSCMLQYGYEMNSKTERSVNIAKSVFEKSAVYITSTESNLNVTVSNCTFSLSNRGTLFVLSPGYDYTLPHFDDRRITIANLQIVDTLFQDNVVESRIILQVVYANLKISNCLFMNNSIKGLNGEGIFVVSSSLILNNTTFLHFSGKSNGRLINLKAALHIKDSSGTIDACLFASNSAFTNGAVFIEDSPLHMSNSIFEGNKCTALRISTCTSRVAVSNCTFRNNSGKEGGALYIEKSEDVVVFNSSFTFNKASDGGGAIYCADSQIRTKGPINSFSNSAETSNGGYAYFSNCNVVTEDPYAEYEYHSNNQASNGGAIYAERGTNIQFKYNTTITNNTASNNGGALFSR